MTTFVTVGDVERVFQRDFTPTSSPSDSEVQSFIEDREGELNNKLDKLGISVPSNSNSFRVCKTMVLKAVQADLVMSFSFQINYTEDVGKYVRLRRDWEDFLSRLENKPEILFDAQIVTTTGLPRGNKNINRKRRQKWGAIFSG